ncbi:MAG: sigma-E processing peptidase SpoIIGA [Firmicutes bacterium]|nr:sigma-E processing peptidase SpoIIGA [Bacillota bacterium]
MVYALPTLGVNATLDLALLWLACRLVGRRPEAVRLGIAAAVGTLPTLWVLLAGSRYAFPWPGAVLWPVIMLRLVLGRVPRPVWLRALMAFYGFGLAAGGMGLAIADLVGPNAAADASHWMPAAGVAAVGLWGPRIWRRNQARWERYGLLQLVVGGRAIELGVLWDSGNRLREPVGHRPVAVIERSAARKWLPEELVRWAEGVLAGQLAPPPEAWRERVGVVRYSSVGGGGQMPVVAVDEARMWYGGRWVNLAPLAAGVSPRPLSPRGEYQALVAPDVQREGYDEGVLGA